jgi:cell wall-associated NlpC family hydrolase
VSLFGARPFDELVVDFALHQLGAPYAWAGRGEYCVRPGPDSQPAIFPVTSQGFGSLAFDCAGLVDWAVWKAGGPDLRGWWGADHLWQRLPERLPDDPPDAYRLAFYGHAGRASHIGIALAKGLVIEAAGGDQTTLTYADAMRRGAYVRIGRSSRIDLLGYRSLLAAKFLPLKP